MKIPKFSSGRAIALMRNMSCAAASRAPEPNGRRAIGRTPSRLLSGEEGGALVETAVMIPIFLTVMLAIFTVGIAMNNFQMLTNSINVGGTTLQQIRNMTAASDPCAAVGTAVMNAAPYLTSSGTNAVMLTITLDNGGYTQGPASASTITCTGGASYVLQGTNASITATYPCNLTIYGVNYAPSCKLHASVTELLQ
jgi:Flp pilus assembly protein TadG